MKMHGKKYRAAKEQVAVNSVSPEEAISQVKKLAYAKFDESVDVNVNLGIDVSTGEALVRGSLTLPHRIGKDVRVIVFAKGEYADKALKAGADAVGANELIDKVNEGWLEFDYAVATPDIMGAVGKLAKLLGPRGLLPNKKVGTVTFDVDAVVADLKKGRTFFKSDKSGLVHFTIGKVSFDVSKINENLRAFIASLSAARPPKAKGKFIRKVTMSSTMGLGIPVNVDELVQM